MGCCIKANKVNKIQVIKTSSNIAVFTSTSNIHEIYSFGKMIGIGVFGKVLVAKQKGNDNKLFAIKVIDKSKIFGRETELANEIYALQKLDHPNIIKFYEVYQNDLYFYICTEFCQGGDLIERIPKYTVCYTEKQCQRYATKILSAIAYIHEQGFLHRDIKPENIMLSQKDLNSEPKLIDFGLAVKLDEIQNRNGTVNCVGTPLYVAPEVIEGYYSDKCDIWSFGVMLYYMLCGYPPFYGANKKELFQHIKNQELIFERRHWTTITPQAKEFLKKLLLKNPFLRPSAKECLKHPWFNVKFEGQQNVRKRTQRASTLRKVVPEEFFEDQRSIYEMLKSYRNGATFKKEVMKVLINQMNEKELEHLKSLFQRIDEDNSGTITYTELQKALLNEGSQVPHDEIKQLMLAIGMDKDEETEDCSSIKSYKPLVIKYSDFLSACIDERKVLTKEKLLSLFKYFDHRNLNYITKENIQEAFARHGKALSEEKIDQMIYEIDPNHDNKISFEEFCMMMVEEGVSQVIDFKDQFKVENIEEEEQIQ